MDIYTASEVAYKNGYEAGVKEFAKRLEADFVSYANYGGKNVKFLIKNLAKELTESKNDLEG